ncbi:MAG: SUMF1/EgtB/PvdO family nonheme iron enzyme [Candidatus Promineifilaceae bacterium]
MTQTDPDRQKLIGLRELLSDSFNLEELRLLCFDLGLDYENLAGGTKTTKMQDLITYLQRRGELQKLLDEVKSQRPNVDWPDFSIGTENSTPTEKVSEEDTAVDTYIDTKTGLVMIRIPAGDFIYGEDRRLEYLPKFWIARTPVTNAHYFKFVWETGYAPPQHWEGKSPREKIADHPVVHVSYEDAAAFAGWAGMDLPDEQEWEKAARGTDGRIYPWGNEWKEGYCNTKEAGIGSTTPAGRFSPRGDSPYGCVDMAGNVYDWTASWYDEEEGWRVLRGGSWSFEQDLASTTYRDGTPHVDRTNDIGFRLVRRFPPGTAAPTEI